MIFVKFFILTLVFISSLSIGNLIAKKYINRLKTLKDMKNALNMFETKIKFTYESIPEIFEEISKQTDGEVKNIFQNASMQMKQKSAGDAWVETIENMSFFMNKEDKAVLKDLGKLLGKTDAEGQISEIELVSSFLDTQIELAESEKNKNEKMYRTLGGIIGLALVIIFI